jgi:hypothetical protein
MKQLLGISGIILLASLVIASLPAQVFAGEDDIVFIHHSCGNNFLNQGLKTQLLTKDYIDEVNDIYYGDDLQPDEGRPDSLGGTPGDKTNMNHWVMWFNDYLEGIRQFDCSNGSNRIIMFKSCYPISNISSDGREPGDPFSSSQTLANYKSVFRKYNDADGIYSRSGNEYTALEKVFANNPDILFIAVTAPPRHFGPSDATNDTEAQRARDFNNWLKKEWLASYKASITGPMNVAVFDWFNVLANPSDHATHPNRLKEEYGGNNGDSHPNATGNGESAEVFSTFIDQAFTEWNEITSVQHWSLY